MVIPKRKRPRAPTICKISRIPKFII
jgi:hypothetical protein